jgi:hypothetical protein
VATIVGAIGTSHSPMLPTNPRLWLERAGQDRTNPMLYDYDGNPVTYDALDVITGGRFAESAELSVWEQRYDECERALDELAQQVAALAPDIVVIVGDDQGEVFERSSEPAIAIYWGEQWQTMILDQNAPGREPGEFYQLAAEGYAMDEVYDFVGHGGLGRHLVTATVEAGFDVMSVGEVPKGRGLGHAFGFVIRRLLKNDTLPVVPVFLNTYYPPNQPTPARCYDFGVALARAIESAPIDARVVIAASGGLSHFVVDEALDRRVLEAFNAHDSATLRAIPAKVLNAGSSEIRNWITVAGAMEGRPVASSTYVPIYRTPAGTGMGMGFVRWS